MQVSQGPQAPNVATPTPLLARLAMLVLLVLVVLLNTRWGGVLADPFHDGEHFAAAVSIHQLDAGVAWGFNLHGALNYLPALAARHVWGDSHYFFPAWLVYRVAHSVACLALVGLFVCLLPHRHRPLWLTAAFVLLAPWLVSHKDTFLLTSMCLGVWLFTRPHQQAMRWLGSVLLTVSMAFGVFWSFDRGLVGLLALMPPLVLSFFVFKDRISAVPLLGVPLLLAAMHVASPLFAFGHYWDNLRFIMQTSHQWGFGLKPTALALTAFMCLLYGLMGWLVVVNRQTLAWRAPPHAALLCLLACLTPLLLQLGVRRADVAHAQNILWLPILVAALAASLQPLKAPHRYWRYAMWAVLLAMPALSYKAQSPAFIGAAALLVFLLKDTLVPQAAWMQRGVVVFKATSALVLVYSLVLVAQGLRQGNYTALLHLDAPPANDLVVPDGPKWVAQQLQQARVPCVLDMTNNGLINALADIPTCSRITYPVYADRAFEGELLAALSHASPPAVVYSTTFFSYSIDGKAMPDRFPALDQALQARYPRLVCAHGYCLRYAQRVNGSD
jgi:hypothetical protein